MLPVLHKHVILIGPMGVGKSSVGKLLATKATVNFVDTDDYIEAKIAPINWIMDKEGESGFRKYEYDCLKKILQENKEPIILATGGGIVVTENCRNLLKSFDVNIVYLQADVDLLMRNTSNKSKRPMLHKAKNPKQFLANMLEVRCPLYRSLADITIDVSKRSKLSAVVQEIIDSLI